MKLLKFNESFLMLGPVETSKYGSINSIAWLNLKIINYTEETYGPYGYTRSYEYIDINVNGTIINSEYLNKMCNNYTIFKKIIYLNNIKSEDEFYKFMIENMYDIYHWEGKYFKKITLPIVIATSKKGNKWEVESFNFFENEIFKKTNKRIKVEEPTIEEDVNGIDGKFFWNNNLVTIQVKPYRSATISKSTRLVKIYSQGSLSLNTTYLILYKEDTFIIVKGKDVEINGNYFIFPEEKIISKS